MRHRLHPPLAGLFIIVLLAGAAPVAGRDIAVTVYNQDLGVVRDARDVVLRQGESELRFSDVAARIDPTSVHLVGPLTVLEQDYSYDLASADKILQRYLDQTIDIVAEEGSAYRGRLLSFDGSALVLAGARGGDDVTIVQRDGVRDIAFPALPEGLITRPTLIWQVAATAAGPAPVELSYMTGGMSWHAEYVAVMSDDAASMELTGWVSIHNQSGASYPEARLKLVAGDVHRVQERRPRRMHTMEARADLASGAAFEERAFFEYHLYELERRTTLADRQIKQLTLFETATTPIRRVYRYDGQRGGKVEVQIEARNDEAVGLGMPLPAGKVRAMQADADGQLEFVGEDMIDHTPRGEEIKVTLGNAFDLQGERLVKDHRRISDRVYEETIEIKLRNRKEEPVEILVIEHPRGSWEILESTHPFEKTEAFKIETTITVTPDLEETIRYTIRTR